MNEEEKYIGYLKYSGKSVEDGLLDARKSAEALLGFDEILRFFLLKEDPALAEIDFEIPVRIKKGSWEALIPETIGGWILAGGGIVATTSYLTSVAKKAGTDGFLETGPAKDIKKTFSNSIKGAQWAIRIASHLKNFSKKKLGNAKIQHKGQEITIIIPNEKNEYLEVPQKYWDLFLVCPEKLFSKNVKIIQSERNLEIGVFENGEDKKVSISEEEKSVFCSEDDDEEIILPELKHDQFVELEGEITRATESANSIGFRYQNHTIVCKPQSGSIAQFKNKIVSQQDNHLFPKVKIRGRIDRKDKNGEFKEKRPQIFFSEIIPIETDDNRQSLF